MLEVSRLSEVLRRGDREVAVLVEEVRSLDQRRRDLQSSLDTLRAERNAANQRMAALDKKSPEFAEARASLRELSQKIKAGESELTAIESEVDGKLLLVPNAPHVSVPAGTSEADNPVVHTWGEKPS